MTGVTEIILTDSAAEHVKKVLGRDNVAVGLRLAVKTTGCSGYQYVVEVAERCTEQDEIFESQGIKIIVDKLSLPLVRGIKMDYVREGLQEKFKFENPNSKETCGCGESFSIA